MGIKVNKKLKESLEKVFSTSKELSWNEMKAKLKAEGVNERLNGLYKQGILSHRQVGSKVIVTYFPDRLVISDDSMKVSFGIEFEGNFISSRGIARQTEDAHATINNSWKQQYDGTAGFEISTSPYTKVSNLAFDSNAQWQNWMLKNPNVAPQFKCNYYHPSIGHHIHIGLKDKPLTLLKKKQIAAATLKILPLLCFISANNPGTYRNKFYISKRMGTSNFCTNLHDSVIESSHYSEISDSHHGTVEFRQFDSNLPQVDFAIASILQKVASVALETDGYLETPDVLTYKQEKSDVLKYGMNGYLVREYFARLINLVGDLDLTQYPSSVKEILYLTFVHCKNACEFLPSYNYKLSSKMLVNTQDFFSNVSSLYSSGKLKRLSDKMKSDTTNVSKLSDILNMKIVLSDIETIAKTFLHGLKHGKSLDFITADMTAIFSANRKQVDRVVSYITDKNSASIKGVRKDISDELGNYGTSSKKSADLLISRIAEVPFASVNDIAEQVGVLLGFTQEQVISDKARFYVATSNGIVQGVVGITVSDNVVLHKKYVTEDAKIALINFMEINHGVGSQCVE